MRSRSFTLGDERSAAAVLRAPISVLPSSCSSTASSVSTSGFKRIRSIWASTRRTWLRECQRRILLDETCKRHRQHGSCLAGVRDICIWRGDPGYGLGSAWTYSVTIDILDLNSTRQASPECAPCSCSVLRACFLRGCEADGRWICGLGVRLRAEGGDRSDQATQDWPSEDSTTENGQRRWMEGKSGLLQRDLPVLAQSGGSLLASTVTVQRWYVSAPQSGGSFDAVNTQQRPPRSLLRKEPHCPIGTLIKEKDNKISRGP